MDYDKSASARPKRPTLRTISELTGLSLSTVSLGLRGGETLREETRQKIFDAAAHIGYIPDRAGVRLRTGKTNVIALVLDGADDSVDFTRHMIRGVGDGLKGTRYHLTVTPEFDQEHAGDSIKYILEHGTADGVILTHTSARDPRVKMLSDAQFPFVTHGRTSFEVQHPFHDFHSELFVSQAVDRLASKGCRRVMLLAGNDKTYNYENIVTAFHQAAERNAMSACPVRANIGRLNSRELRHLGLQIATQADRPDGVVCASEMRAISIIGGLIDGGITPGKQMQVISKQTSDILPAFFPTMDTIEEDVRNAGEILTGLLLRRIEGEPIANLQSLSEPIVHWRS